MPTKRIIPCLDTKHGKLVKGVRFRNVKDIGDPPEFAKRYEEEGADELVLLDIVATPENKPTFIEVIKRVAEVISIPLTVGGGIRTVEEATKVSVNTAAVKRPELLREFSREFGKERVVSAIDAKIVSKGKWEVYVSGGVKPTGLDMVEWAKHVKSLGVGEILYTGVHTDGTREGYDVEGTRAIAEATSLPVIASGGAGTLEHIYEVLTTGKADAALAASIFHFRDYTIGEIKRYLAERGVPVRL
jgi:cyclase